MSRKNSGPDAPPKKDKAFSVEPSELEGLDKSKPTEKPKTGEYTDPPYPDDGKEYHDIPVNMLPSMGMPYPGLTRIPMRQWSTVESERISEVPDNRVDLAIRDQLQKSTPFNLDDVTYGDSIYLLLWQRVNTFGQYHPINFTDANGKVHRIEADISEIPNDKLNPLYADRKPLEVGGKKLDLDVPRERDYKKRLTFVESYPNVPERIILYASTIRLVDGQNVSLENKVELLVDIPAKEFKKVEAWHDFFYHGPREELTFLHPLTGENVTHPHRFRFNFFIPEGEFLFDVESKIRGDGGDQRGSEVG